MNDGRAGQSDSPRDCPPRWRALVIGLVFSLTGFYFGTYGYQIVQALVWGHTTLPVGGVFVLFIITGLAAALGLLWRRLRLQTAELLIIFVMTTITGAIGGAGGTAFLVPTLPAGHYYATAENNFEAFFEHIPWWLTVNDGRVIEAFYEANGSLYTLATLRAWAAPLTFWLIFTALLVLGTWALCNLVSEQWVSRERLTFPLAQLPLAMAGAGPTSGFWADRLMWIGFALPLVLQSANFVNYLHPAFPTVWVKARPVAQNLTRMPLRAIQPLYVAFFPFMIGVGYLLSLETSLSCWLFFWLRKLERVIAAMLGLGSGGPGEGITQLPLIWQQGTGALLTIGAVTAWIAYRSARKHLGNTDPEGVQVISSQASMIVLGVALVGLVAMSNAAGLPILIAVSFFVLRWLIALAWARVAAETGSGWIVQASGNVHGAVVAVTGTAGLAPTALPIVAMFRWFNRHQDEPSPQLLGAYKLRELGAIPRRQLRDAFLVAIVVAILFTTWTHLDIYYRHGAAMAETRQWYTDVGLQPWRVLESWIIRPMGPDFWQVGGYLLGGAVALLLRHASLTISSWPLHPLGYALANTMSMNYIWMPFLIAWLIKSAVLRYGGFKAYRRLVPLFMGLMLGDFVVAGMWGLYGVISSHRMYMHFPH